VQVLYRALSSQSTYRRQRLIGHLIAEPCHRSQDGREKLPREERASDDSIRGVVLGLEDRRVADGREPDGSHPSGKAPNIGHAECEQPLARKPRGFRKALLDALR
jgi:hypothetical protein